MHPDDSKEAIADRLLWPGESRERFFALYSKFTIDYRPESDWEVFLIGHMAGYTWRQIRLRNMLAERPDHPNKDHLQYLEKLAVKRLKSLASQIRFEKTTRRRRNQAA